MRTSIFSRPLLAILFLCASQIFIGTSAAQNASTLHTSLTLDSMKKAIQADLPADFQLRAKTPFGTLTYRVDEISSLTRLPNGSERLTTIYGDSLVAPWRMDRILDAANDLRKAVARSSGADAEESPRLEGRLMDFATGAKTAVAPSPDLWRLKTTSGDTLFAIPSPDDSSLSVTTPSGVVDIPFSLLSLFRTGKLSTMFGISLSDGTTFYAFKPRGTLAGLTPAGVRVRIDWENLAEAAPVNAPGKSTHFSAHDVTLTLHDGSSLAASLPAGLWPLRTADATYVLTSSALLSAVPNPDSTVTLRTIYGDVLSGRLLISPVLSATNDDGRKIAFTAVANLTIDNATPAPRAPGAYLWRLRSGDLLVATYAPPAVELPVSSGTWRATASRIRPAAAHADSDRPSAKPATSVTPLPTTDPITGRWRSPSFALTTQWGQDIDLPSKSLLAAYDLAPADCPPVAAPDAIASPSARATDEILIPGGTFRLGRSGADGPADETPAIALSIPPFYLGTTPITVSQFTAFVEATRTVTDAQANSSITPSWLRPGFSQSPDDPVVFVSWRDAARYCNWRSKLARLTPAYDIPRNGNTPLLIPGANGYRLPYEAEWEYAARNLGQDILFPWGDDDSEANAIAKANFFPRQLALDPWPATSPVNAFPPNPLGLRDMAGNVAEWCQDIYQQNAYALAARDPAAFLNPGSELAEITRRVTRGGSWSNSLSFLRTRARAWCIEQRAAHHIGFRIARDAPISDSIFPADLRPSSFRGSTDSLSIPFLAQPPDLCGPAALYMIEKFFGSKPDLDALVAAAHLPALKGSIPELLADAARRDGFQAAVLHNLPTSTLHALLLDKQPLILLLGPDPEATDGDPRGHFIVLTSHDLATDDITAHSGATKNRAYAAEQWLPRWNAAGNVAVLITPATAEETSPDDPNAPVTVK